MIMQLWKKSILIFKLKISKSKLSYSGLYVGTAGIAYMFYYLANSYNFREKRSEFLHYAQSYIESSLYFHNYRTR